MVRTLKVYKNFLKRNQADAQIYIDLLQIQSQSFRS